MLKTTALYSPSTGKWTAGPTLAAPLIGHAAVLLKSGKVLILGGFSLDATSTPVTSRACLLFDPKTNSLGAAPSLPYPSALHSAVPLPDGTILVAGAGPSA